MKSKQFLFMGLLCALIITAPVMAFGVAKSGLQLSATTPGTAFTYQGQVKKAGAPFKGTCSFQLGLFNALTGGSQVGSLQSYTGVVLSNGTFTIPELDFGAGAFPGSPRWLEVAIQCAGDTDYTTLSPRQPLTPVPYAQFAQVARLAKPHEVIVAPWLPTAIENGNVLLAVLNGISDASAENPYVLRVQTGTYDLGNQSLHMKPFVDIEGDGELDTIITALGYTCLPEVVPTDRGMIVGANDAELRKLTVKNTGGECTCGMFNLDVSPHLRQVTILASGGSQSNLGMHNQYNRTGGRPVDLEYVTVIATSNTTESVAIRNFIGSWVEIRDSTLIAQGASPSWGGVMGMEINNATVKLRRVSVSSTSLGVQGFSAMPGAYCLAEMDDVRIQAVDHTLEIFGSNGSTDVIMRVRSSNLNGGPVNMRVAGMLTCQAVYDENNTFFENTCP